ncbi:Smr/MutS family protein [Jannaschia sp. S6380]|uniref:Smr/MutS family protein n=1 Tax=Jannaschia sp. S6380 TaxID=2926408 RepID=UPI001FF65929|nr:Smr/MutS family protein [Jannaschia sp. S6380]MCK0168432.1 Smr/MutS family protein [Jannaschia sp. S6380]
MKRRPLSREDRELWSRYTRTAEALHPPGQGAAPDPGPPPRPGPAKGPDLPRFRLGEQARDRNSTHVHAPSLAEEVASQPLRMDARAHRRMKAGKLRPEGTLDLHGMTLDQAHPALLRFILSAHASGKRLVIVVTGKGRTKPSEGPIPNRLGVLRHQVPQWLRLAPLVQVVLQVTEAHRSHGGSGAYYVYLRRG